jgi:hypothetical protein
MSQAHGWRSSHRRGTSRTKGVLYSAPTTELEGVRGLCSDDFFVIASPLNGDPIGRSLMRYSVLPQGMGPIFE